MAAQGTVTDWRKAPFPGMLAIPASAGEPIPAIATVKYRSNGYFLTQCEITVSSGDPVADPQACRTLSFRKTRIPLIAEARVWKSPPFDGNFVRPFALTDPGKWIGFEDYPTTFAQGTVTLRFDLDTAGVTKLCDIIGSSNSSSIDRIVKTTVCKRAKFSPASIDGKPVASIVITSIRMYSGR